MTTVVRCVPTAPATTPMSLTTIKSQQQRMWASGDFAVVGTTLQIVGELLCEAVDLRATERVLDVAAGNGNATLAAARRFAAVTSTDYVSELLASGRRRAEAEGLVVTFQTADAEALPFETGSFDVVLSTFGVMFAPDQERAASELVRVCRPGGRIGLASWTPDGFVGQLFKVVGRHVPPNPALRSPVLWGTDARVRELFGGAARTIAQETRMFVFRYRSPEHWVEVFRTYFGPVHKAFASLDADGQRALETDLLALLLRFDRGDATGLVVPGEYAETVITCR